jgi:hypothetical protein
MRGHAAKLLHGVSARPAFLVSLAASLVVHGVGLVWLGWTPGGQVGIETGSIASETVLLFREPEPVPVEPPVEKAVEESPLEEPEPEVVPEPEPEPVLAIEKPAVKSPVAQPAPVAQAPVQRPTPRVPAVVQSPSIDQKTQDSTVFAGVEARRARRIVYVVDASGPMASSLAFVKSELARSIGRLAADQSFQVLFFRETADGSSGVGFSAFGASSGGTELHSATPESKKQLLSWLSTIRPGGRSNPRAALEAAINLRPEVVFVLSRRIKRTNVADAAAEVRDVMSLLDRINPQDHVTGVRPVVVKTIQFLDDDPSGMLQQIAETHGDGAGSYRLLTLEQLPKGR